jgi:hypothetical protein
MRVLADLEREEVDQIVCLGDKRTYSGLTGRHVRDAKN